MGENATDESHQESKKYSFEGIADPRPVRSVFVVAPSHEFVKNGVPNVWQLQREVALQLRKVNRDLRTISCPRDRAIHLGSLFRLRLRTRDG